MLLAKSCMKDFNIKKGTIKLGTLQEYRETELQHIADKKEGHLKFKLIFDNLVELSNKWFNTLSGNQIRLGKASPFISPGSTNVNCEELDIAELTSEKMIVRYARVTIEQQSLNGFVFCMSSIRKTLDCIDIFPEYDDYWYMPQIRALHFGYVLGSLLRNAIIENHKKGNPITKELCIDDFSVNLKMGPVHYIPREIHITNDNKFELDELLEHLSHISFIKPPTPFKKEREFRFNYTIVSKNHIIEPSVKSIILDASELQQYIL